MERTIKLPCYGIEVNLTGDGGGSVSSALERAPASNEPQNVDPEDVIESIVLAHAIAGVDIESREYVEGIMTAVDAIANNS